MFLKSLFSKIKRISANDLATSAFTIAVFVYVVIFGMDLLFKTYTKQRITTGTEMAMRYLSTSPGDFAGANTLLSNYAATAWGGGSGDLDLKTGAWLGYPNNSCLPSCTNDLTNGSGGYDFRATFTVGAEYTLQPIIPIVFLRIIDTNSFSTGTLEYFSTP